MFSVWSAHGSLYASLPTFKENSGFLLNALLTRGLSEEQSVPDPVSAAIAAADAFKLDAMTPEPEDLDTVAPNSPVPSPPPPQSLVSGPQFSSEPGFSSADPLEEELRSRLSQLVSRANSKDNSSSGEECAQKRPMDKQIKNESDRQSVKQRSKDTDRERHRANDMFIEQATEAVEEMNGPEMIRSQRLITSVSMREEGRVRERRLQRAGGSLKEKVDDQEQKRGDKRDSNRQSKRDGGGQKGGAKRSGSSASSPAVSPISQEGALSNNQVSSGFSHFLLLFLALYCFSQFAVLPSHLALLLCVCVAINDLCPSSGVFLVRLCSTSVLSALCVTACVSGRTK